MQYKLKVHILEQTKEVEIETDPDTIANYVNGCLDANIFPQDSDDKPWSSSMHPQGEYSGLDALHCEITLID